MAPRRSTLWGRLIGLAAAFPQWPRLLRGCNTLLRPAAPCCALLRPAAPCCALLRPAALALCRAALAPGNCFCGGLAWVAAYPAKNDDSTQPSKVVVHPNSAAVRAPLRALKWAAAKGLCKSRLRLRCAPRCMGTRAAAKGA